jgi:hypothetical protein
VLADNETEAYKQALISVRGERFLQQELIEYEESERED